MSRKSTKKGTRSQGRKTAAVVIPPIPELHEHANAIRSLARRSFDDIVEIGRRLTCCRKLLKNDRVWMAWLSAEFSWSRRTADRLIDLFQAKDKLRKLRSLGVPVSALYELVKASPKLVRQIERDIKAGGQLSIEGIRQRARAERMVDTATPITPWTLPRVNLTAPKEPKTEPLSLTADDVRRAEADHHAVWLPQELATFARHLRGLPAPADIAAALPAEKRATVIEDIRAITTDLNALLEALWEAGRPRVVSDRDDADLTKH